MHWLKIPVITVGVVLALFGGVQGAVVWGVLGFSTCPSYGPSGTDTGNICKNSIVGIPISWINDVFPITVGVMVAYVLCVIIVGGGMTAVQAIRDRRR
jgi:hypothetical protein